jgi:hypothetical protein
VIERDAPPAGVERTEGADPKALVMGCTDTFNYPSSMKSEDVGERVDSKAG